MNAPHPPHIPHPAQNAQRRGPWSQYEDNLLMSLVQNQGALNWVRISQTLKTRTPKQCRERYHQNLKPTLNHDPITPEEGRLIEQHVAEIGKRWAEIARRLPGRSDNAVKNWWNGSQNRRKRQDRRKASHAHYDDRSDMVPHYGATAHLSIPRTLPPPDLRHPPPPRLHLGHEGHNYYPEPPLSSPSTCSAQSELAPSLMSDCGSHYSTSPKPFSTRDSERRLELAPIKMGAHISPRPSTSPINQHKLPPITTVVPHGPSPYSATPPSAHSILESHHRYSPPDYFSVPPRGTQYYPAPLTAPNSPLCHPGKEERNTKVDISKLLQS
ncbi:hypothetical protein OQA88_13590 [Cercophora sp. LCS_1]